MRETNRIENKVSKFWLEDWQPGHIEHDRQTDDSSCGVHVIEVKNDKLVINKF